MDQNDNKPIFQMADCQATFPEDLSSLQLDEIGNHVIDLNIVATDKDISANYSSSSIVYGLSPQSDDGLRIRTIQSEDPQGTTRGELFIDKGKFPFDFERAQQYSIKVSVSRIKNKFVRTTARLPYMK